MNPHVTMSWRFRLTMANPGDSTSSRIWIAASSCASATTMHFEPSELLQALSSGRTGSTSVTRPSTSRGNRLLQRHGRPNRAIQRTRDKAARR